jgi:hypothetical protein
MKAVILNKPVMAITAGAVALLFAGTALAAKFDPETGTGFVGKGEVQGVFGWNNHQLQANADDVQFRAFSEVVTKISWKCTTSPPSETTVELSQTTTTTIQGLLQTVARTGPQGQNTGFNLVGYNGEPTESSTTVHRWAGVLPVGT